MIALRLQPGGASVIVILLLLCVLRTIKLDDNFSGVPGKIRTVTF